MGLVSEIMRELTSFQQNLKKFKFFLVQRNKQEVEATVERGTDDNSKLEHQSGTIVYFSWKKWKIFLSTTLTAQENQY